MKVSFLVTFYNQKEFVQQALDSILAIHKPFDWEIRVGDDGSRDGTVDVVNEYIKEYPDNIFLHIMPRDVSKKYDSVERASMNRLNLLENATGDFFCFLDGDDYYCDHDFVNEAVEIFRRNETVSVVMFGYRYFGDKVANDEVMLSKEYHQCYVEKREYLRSFYIHAGACVYRRYSDRTRLDYIKKLGYFDDNDIVINNLHYGEIFNICRVIYAYRQTGNSIYTSMNRVEQAALNVLGYDVDMELVESQYRKDIKQRYRYSILVMYLLRRQLQEILGVDKYSQYLTRSSALKDALSHKLMAWKTMTQKERRSVFFFVLPLILRDVKFVLKVRLGKWL